ncbi:MAG: hypothetical protein QM813_03485 [Verrucomicrobiota bacterium]
MSKLKIAAVLAIFIGPVLMVMAYLEKKEYDNIAKNGVETVGIPMVKTASAGRKSSRTYKVELEYKDEVGTTKSATLKISKELYDRVDAMPVLRLKYLKADPNQMIVVGFPNSSAGGITGGLVVFLLGVGGTAFFFLRPGAQEE